MRVPARIAAAFLVCACAWARPPAAWTLARSGHFEVYSDAGADASRALAEGFERLRAFFLDQSGHRAGARDPVRIVNFGSAREYEAYRIRPGADAFFIGAESRDYIVMPASGRRRMGLAAHEYAHLLMHESRLSLPPWLGEGIADVFSTVQAGEKTSLLGGDLPGRSSLLRSGAWMPLAELLAARAGAQPRERGPLALFYAGSWALTDMLLFSPEYAPRFPALFAALSSGVPGMSALEKVYRRTPDAVSRDLREWVRERRSRPVALAGVGSQAPDVRITALDGFAVRSVLADLLLAAGDLARAEARYRELARDAPAAPEIPAALGTIALRKGDRTGARRAWERALELGISDPAVCYRYAVVADELGLPAARIRPALERAVALKPDFDDANFRLGLLEQNSGNSRAALERLRAVREVAPGRAFAYWTAMADVLIDLGEREEAKAAARRARDCAATAADRERSEQILYLAGTDFSVQLTWDAEGRPHGYAVRVPHNAPAVNPFIVPGDRIERVEATLSRIDCDGKTIRFGVSTSHGELTLAVPDPSRVQIRTAGGISFEFTCGPQDARRVLVEYAASGAGGILRGLEFR